MISALSIRRLAENEAFFRQYNEKVQEGLQVLESLAASEGHADPENNKLVLQFYCECSDEKCTLRIPVRLSTYATIHRNRRHFIVKPGHETTLIEKVIKKTSNYYVVEKYINVPEQPRKPGNTERDAIWSVE